MGTGGIALHAVTALMGAVALQAGPNCPSPICLVETPGVCPHTAASCGIPRENVTSFRCPSPLQPVCKHKGDTRPQLMPRALGYHPPTSTHKGCILLFSSVFAPISSLQQQHFRVVTFTSPLLSSSHCKSHHWGWQVHREEENPATRRGRNLLSPEGHPRCNDASQIRTEVLSNCSGNHFTCVGFFRLKYNYS